MNEQDDIRIGIATYLANAAIASGLCLIQTATAKTVGVPTVGTVPLYVSQTAATAAAEQIECVPIEPGKEMRVRANGTITAGDKCEITLSGADAGKVVTLSTGIPQFIALESGVDEDFILVRALPTNGIRTGQPTPATLNATGTMADGDVLAGILTSTTGAAVAGTTRTGTQLTAELAHVPVGGFHDLSIINTGGNTFTLTAGTDVSIVGAAAVATVTSARFRFKRSTSTVWIAYRLS